MVYLLLLFFPAISVATVAPAPSDEIDFNAFHVAYLEQLVKARIDSFRVEQGRYPMAYDPVLVAAARDQARYLQRMKTVGHYQRWPAKRTVLDRAWHYGAKGVVRIGENALRTYPARLKRWDPTIRRYREFFYHTYASMAEQIFNAWLNSSSHLQTMLMPEFKYTGFAIQMDPATKALYCVQVFAVYSNR